MIKYLKRNIEKLRKKIRKNEFHGSATYWENRYKQGGNSGAGSYNRLAEFKANIINDFCVKNNIEKVIEFGCGDGNQLTLAKYQQYIGLDVSKKSIELCNNMFANDATKQFYELNKVNLSNNKFHSSLAISLDVIFHLIEDDVYYVYMNNLFNASSKYVIIYASNYEAKTLALHVKHRCFTDYVFDKFPKFKLIKVVKNKYPFECNNPNNTSFSDFYFFQKKESLKKNN
ncbi:MAG: class I SAM-dependent methyltransferase [Bacteroidales bacterium]|jgi:SAM-dependent methyltransferase|nr:class I SAM-dependent methyltransferase [Bacteroidales bacterium]